MQITRAGEYGILGLLRLARSPGLERMVMIDEISQSERIPKSFLAKIFQDLVRAGLVRSFRGSGGGFCLARPADRITVLDVIEAIEGKIALQRCLQETPECDHMEGCVLCNLLERAQDRVKEVFGATTLADLLKPDAPVGLSHRRTGLPVLPKADFNQPTT